MLVYRFENPEGKGPWKGRGTVAYDDNHRCRNEYHSCYDMPGPIDETGELGEHYTERRGFEGWSFGFATKTQLKQAFPSKRGRAHMQALANQWVHVYEVTPVAVVKGRAQVIFRKAHARHVAKLDAATLKQVA